MLCLYYCGLMKNGQVYAILDECFLAGEVEETNKRTILNRLYALDKMD